jgi:hypothetical protein
VTRWARTLVVPVLGGWLMIGCIHTDRSPMGVHVFDAGVRQALERYDGTLSEKRIPVVFASGETATTCVEYLKMAQSGPVAESVNNRIAAQEYCICTSIQTIAAAIPDTTYLPKSYGRELLRRLDLRSFASSLRPAANETRFTLADLAPVPAKADRYTCSFRSADWEFQIEVIAELDYDHDGRADWLVRLTDEARQSTYRDYRILIVSEVAAAGYLKAKALPW